ncbi:hypothetical protein SMICM17S_11452 [Streptomyces microflavus]
MEEPLYPSLAAYLEAVGRTLRQDPMCSTPWDNARGGDNYRPRIGSLHLRSLSSRDAATSSGGGTPSRNTVRSERAAGQA